MGYLKINIVVCIEMNAHKDKDRLPLNDTKLRTLYIYTYPNQNVQILLLEWIYYASLQLSLNKSW